jgi:hypothetical protein
VDIDVAMNRGLLHQIADGIRISSVLDHVVPGSIHEATWGGPQRRGRWRS